MRAHAAEGVLIRVDALRLGSGHHLLAQRPETAYEEVLLPLPCVGKPLHYVVLVEAVQRGCPDRLIVFVKAPRPGVVKTRLAAALGEETAARLYRVLAEEEIRRTAPVRRAYRRSLLFAPSDARAELEAWLPGEALAPQSEGDLGARMARAFADAFARGARRVILIGTDTPWVSQEHVCRALALLDEAELVLGPAEDGGYYLIGLKRPRPQLFAGIAWSTPSVLRDTLALAEKQGLSIRMLERLADVDTLEDVRAHWAELQAVLARAPELRDEVARSMVPTAGE